MNQLDWHYLGGFFDGEGSVGLYLYKQKNTLVVTPSIQISNSMPLLEEIKKFLAIENITSNIHGLNLKISVWGDIEKFILKILPHTILKTDELKLLLGACDFYTKHNVSKDITRFAEISLQLSKFKGRKGQQKKYLVLVTEILERKILNT